MKYTTEGSIWPKLQLMALKQLSVLEEVTGISCCLCLVLWLPESPVPPTEGTKARRGTHSGNHLIPTHRTSAGVNGLMWSGFMEQAHECAVAQGDSLGVSGRNPKRLQSRQTDQLEPLSRFGFTHCKAVKATAIEGWIGN